MQLAEQGKIDIDQPLSAALPEFSITSWYRTKMAWVAAVATRYVLVVKAMKNDWDFPASRCVKLRTEFRACLASN